MPALASLSAISELCALTLARIVGLRMRTTRRDRIILVVAVLRMGGRALTLTTIAISAAAIALRVRWAQALSSVGWALTLKAIGMALSVILPLCGECTVITIGIAMHAGLTALTRMSRALALITIGMALTLRWECAVIAISIAVLTGLPGLRASLRLLAMAVAPCWTELIAAVLRLGLHGRVLSLMAIAVTLITVWAELCPLRLCRIMGLRVGLSRGCRIILVIGVMRMVRRALPLLRQSRCRQADSQH